MFNSGETDGICNSGYEGVAEFYNLFADNSDIPFYLSYARKAGGAILDIASGTGRVALELARNGFEVVALEKSPSMLAVARKKLEGQPADVAARVSIIEGSMTNFLLNRKFNLIIIPSSFGHATTTEAQLSTLQCIRNHLSPNGIFILDLFPGSKNLEPIKFQDPPAKLEDGRVVKRSGTMIPNVEGQTLQVKLTYEIIPPKGGQRSVIDIVSHVAIIFNREANLLLKAAGLQVLEEFGSFQGEPYSNLSHRRILVLGHNE